MMTTATATDAKRLAPAMIALVPGTIAIGRSATLPALVRAGQREIGP